LIAYFDTTALVPLLVEESGSGRGSVLWDSAERVFSTRLVYAEGRAALAMAARAGRMSRSALRDAVENFEDLYQQIGRVEVSEGIVHRAGELAELYSLRGYDAVHLAAADVLPPQDLVLVSGDGPLCRAAEAIGIAVSRIS
jgi:hypothetical protein